MSHLIERRADKQSYPKHKLWPNTFNFKNPGNNPQIGKSVS